jgi:methionyl-tRNA formyltransferase
MRIALIGQAAFGEAVSNALRGAGEEIVAVSSITGTEERPDALYAAARAAGMPFFETGNLKKPGVLDAYAATKPELGVMAFVTHILPQRVLDLPPLGTVQYHPSLLPRHRGISAMHWAIRSGETKTGLTIFWVEAGIDTGPILLQREAAIAPDDTVGSLYFDKLFALGVASLVEAVRLVREGRAPKIAQDDAKATYEPPADDANSGIVWALPARRVYDLIRGSNPSPGAHATFDGARVRFFDARLSTDGPHPPAPSPSLSRGGGASTGTVLATGESIDIALDGGVLHARWLSLDGGKKLAAAEFAEAAGVVVGARFGDGSAARL